MCAKRRDMRAARLETIGHHYVIQRVQQPFRIHELWRNCNLVVVLYGSHHGFGSLLVL